MRKCLLSAFIALSLLIGANELSAQSAADGTAYRSAIGLGIDFGDGATLVGISGKHFFTTNHAGAAEVLFGDNLTVIQALYQYHKEIEGAPGLRWYAGVGPGVQLYRRGSSFLLRPLAGLDFKIANAPLAFSFDWRPAIILDSYSDFEPARFGLGFRFAFN